MGIDIRSVVAEFVDQVGGADWQGGSIPSTVQTAVLLVLVSAAGFKPKEVVVGKLVGYYRDQDGSRTGKTFPINSLCPFKVIGQDGKDDYFATGWLDCTFRRVVYGVSALSESRNQLIEAITAVIAKSVPLELIQLTPEGDMLSEYPPRELDGGLAYFVKHTRDGDPLNTCVGVHVYCNGWMYHHDTSETHSVIVCRNCHLRVSFPREVKTYGELRQALAEQLANLSA